MSAKVINKTTTGDESFARVSELAKKLKDLGASIAVQKEEFDNARKDLITLSTTQFFADLDKPVPELAGNHEYHTDDGIVNINFRVVAKPMVEINKQPASVVLKKMAGDSYGAMFKEETEVVPEVDYPNMLLQATAKPELFALKLRDLTPDQMKTLVSEHPEWVEVCIRDINEYTKHFPASTKSTVTVKPQGNFVDACAALPNEVRVRVQGFLKKFLQTALQPALSTGNSAKTASKK